jgi:hypothetical protein
MRRGADLKKVEVSVEEIGVMDSIRIIRYQALENHTYWVSGLCPSSGILNIRKHNVLETGSVSVLR